MYGDVKLYGCTVCRCMGQYRHMGGCMGAYKHTGAIQISGGVQVYGGMYRCMGLYRCGSHIDIPRHTDSQTYPPHTCQLYLGPGFLIKFRFVPNRHILLAHQLA